jgi:hypothetical protein
MGPSPRADEMIAVTLADLVFRARQFIVAIIGVSLVRWC